MTARATVREPEREIPIVSELDVAVVGGGTAGVMAAVGAARAGARTCLVERLGSVGGAVNMGMIGHLGNYFRDSAGRDAIAGAPREFLERLVAGGGTPYPSLDEALRAGRMIFYRHVHAGHVCFDMLQESGVELWLHARFCDALPAPQGGYDLIIETKGGRQAVRARQVVDCSGEADVAVALGAPVKVGTDRSWGLIFEMGHVDLDRYQAFLDACPATCPGWDEWLLTQVGMSRSEARADWYWGEWLEGRRRAWPFRPQIIEAVDAGDFSLIRDLPGGGRIRYGWDGFWPEPWHGTDAVYANVCMVTELNPRDGRDVSKAEQAARAYAFEFLGFLRKYIPGFENAVIRVMAGQTMPRGGSEIVGETSLTADDFDGHTFPDDTVCLVGGATVFGLPLRMFVPKGIDDLLVAGKCASSGYSVRASVSCMAAGYSCGIVSAVCAAQGVTPMALAPDDRRHALLGHGVLLAPGAPAPDGWTKRWPDLPGVPAIDPAEGAQRAKKLS